MAIVTSAANPQAPRFRYASALAQSIDAVAGTIVVSSAHDLQGRSSNSAVDAAPLVPGLVQGGGAVVPAAGSEPFVRLLQFETSVATSCIPSAARIKVELMQVTSVTWNNDGTLTLGVIRATQGNQNPTPDAELINVLNTVMTNASNLIDGTGVYIQGSSSIQFERDNATVSAHSFSAGAIVENLTYNALLRDAEGANGADPEEYAVDIYRGDVRFLKIGATTAGGRQLYTGMKVNSLFGYKTSSAKRVNLGRFIPILEFTVELEHRFPDGRYFKFRGHRCAVTPENPSFDFQPTDWIGAELQIDVLQSFDIAHEANPYGYIEIDNDPITLQPVATVPETYSAGVYNLYLTPNSTSRAITQGLPSTRFSIGNVRTGNLSAPQEFLEHYVGIPQIQDAKIRLKYQMNLTTTIESLTAENMALLFNGSIEDIDNGVAPMFKLVTVSAAPDPQNLSLSLANVNHPLGFIMLDAG
jgi:hypothetical protein